MSRQTVSEAKAQQEQQQNNGPAAVIEKYRPDLSIVLPSHVRSDTWMRVAMSAARKSADLWAACKASPETMMAALYHAARLGLEPGTDQFHLTPRKRKGKWEVLGIVGYQGEVELIYRAGAVSSVIVELVRANDRFQYVLGVHERPVHHVDWFGDRGEVKGAYAYGIMKDGAVSKVVVVDEARIKRAMEASATVDSSHSPWTTDYGAMVLKTAAHDLKKWVPTSAEYREQLREDARAGAVTSGITEGKTAQRLDQFVPPLDVVDGEIVDPDDQPSADDAPAPAAAAVPEPPAGGQPAEQPAERDPAADASTQPVGQAQMRRIFALLRKRGVEGDEARLRAATHVLDRDITSFKELTADDASALINRLEKLDSELGPPPSGQEQPGQSTQESGQDGSDGPAEPEGDGQQ
jgi:recombination protein RecT